MSIKALPPAYLIVGRVLPRKQLEASSENHDSLFSLTQTLPTVASFYLSYLKLHFPIFSVRE